MPERRTLAFLVLCAAAIALAVGYVLLNPNVTSVDTPTATLSPAPAAPVSSAPEPTSRPAVATPGDQPESTTKKPAPPAHAPARHVFFRDTSLTETHGRLIEASVDALAIRQVTGLTCERVDFSNGRGVCLIAKRGFVTVYSGVTFDATFKPQHQFSLAGVPSRVRVSPDGTRAGMTVFVSGDSYAPGSFSTRTTIIDTASGESLGDLEEYTVIRDGQPFKAIDFNFWGVTFASASRIYATLGTGGKAYLVDADIDAKRATIRHEGVECPSISPDRTRIAFKKRMPSDGGRLVWRLHVLDLRTGRETALSEIRSVDDQAEWLDASTVTYALPSDSKPGSTDVWSVPADGSGEPTKIVTAAWSPAFFSAD